ncbi:sodium/proton antiporter, partial [Pseudomonas donghuensis]|nr:sodium/proton antiporter [Pseudomonas donghuensis]
DSEFSDDRHLPTLHHADLEQFRAFLRSLLMHGAVGTALGGVCTLVGEPQNLLIGHEMGWHFAEFFLKVAPVSLPVLAAGLV